MDDPNFRTADGLAATVLVAALIEELMDNGVFGSAHRGGYWTPPCFNSMRSITLCQQRPPIW